MTLSKILKAGMQNENAKSRVWDCVLFWSCVACIWTVDVLLQQVFASPHLSLALNLTASSILHFISFILHPTISHLCDHFIVTANQAWAPILFCLYLDRWTETAALVLCASRKKSYALNG